MRIHFFPALLPLTAVLPWLLSAVGVVASFFVRRGRFRTAVKVLAVTCLVGAAALFARHWQKQKSLQGSRLTPVDALPVSTPAEVPTPSAGGVSPTRLKGWERLSPRHNLSTPAIGDGLVLVGTTEGTLDAYRLGDGAPLWSLRKSEPIYVRPAIVGVRAYVGEGLHTAMSSKLTAVSLPDGKPIWERQFLGHLEATPLVDATTNTLWFGAGPQGAWALDTESGEVRWRAEIGHVDATPLLTADRKLLVIPAHVETDPSQTILYALEPESGREIWRLPLPGQPWVAPLEDRATGNILATTSVGRLGPRTPDERGWAFAIRRTGSAPMIEWQQPFPGMPLFNGAQDPELRITFHSLKAGQILALENRTGKIQWSIHLGADLHAPATWLGGKPARLGALTVDGFLHLIDPRTGKRVRKLPFSVGSSSSPAAAEIGGESAIIVVTPEAVAMLPAAEK